MKWPFGTTAHQLAPVHRGDVRIAETFPPLQRQALVLAAAVHDEAEIDRITDELVKLGFCRPRKALSLAFAPKSAWVQQASPAGDAP